MDRTKSNECTKQMAYFGVLLTADERRRLDAICGRGRAQKKGAWVREAILERLEAWERGTSVKVAARKPA